MARPSHSLVARESKLLTPRFIQKRQASRGAALFVELLLGLALITFSILAIFGIFPTADRAVAQADRTTQATYIARNLMEQKLSLDFIDLSTDPDDQEEGDIVLQHSKRRGQAGSTTFHYRIQVTQPDPDQMLKQIVVRVSWMHGSLQGSESVILECDKTPLW